MTAAQEFHDQRATADLRMGVIAMQAVRPAADLPGLSEVWCSRCERPALAEFTLTTGERKAYCMVKHAPFGARGGDR